MKILILGLNYAPEPTGVGKYTGEMAAWLQAQGHDVRVVTAYPYYPYWRLFPGFKSWRWQADLEDGVKVLRCPIWVPAVPSGVKRLLHLLSFAVSSTPSMISQWFWRPQVVWTVEPSLMSAPLAVVTAKLTGAKSWLHIQDFEVDAAFSLGIVRGERLRKMVLRFERLLLRHFDAISTISNKMRDLALTKGVESTRFRMFRNWVDTRPFAQDSSQESEEFRRNLDVPVDAILALYAGNMGAKQGLEIMAAAARDLASKRSNVCFVFCGAGSGRDELFASCSDLDNVRFVDVQPQSKFLALLKAADVHLLPQRADAADLVMPSKLTGMLASGRPVVATAALGTELEEVVRDCGKVVSPGDVAAFSAAIESLAASKELRQDLGLKAREYAGRFLEKESILADFESELSQLVSKEHLMSEDRCVSLQGSASETLRK